MDFFLLKSLGYHGLTIRKIQFFQSLLLPLLPSLQTFSLLLQHFGGTFGPKIKLRAQQREPDGFNVTSGPKGF